MKMTQAQVDEHQRRVKGPPLLQSKARVSVEAAKPSKYSNRRTRVGGRVFASGLEARYFQQLQLRKKAGEVLWHTEQVGFWLEGGVRYVLDFLYLDAAGVMHFVDTTGVMTPTKRDKLKQLRERHGIVVEIVMECA